MAKKIFYSSILYTIIICIVFVACSEQNIPSIYSVGKNWKFLVKKSNNSYIDTLNLYIYESKTDSSQKNIAWSYIYFDTNGNILKDSITEKKPSKEMFNDYYVSFTFPQNLKMFNDEYLHIPKLRMPIKMNYESNETVAVKKFNDDGSLNNNFQHKFENKITDKIFYKNFAINDTCWVLESKSINESKIFNKFYFSEKYGFVFLLFQNGKTKIEIELIDFK